MSLPCSLRFAAALLLLCSLVTALGCGVRGGPSVAGSTEEAPADPARQDYAQRATWATGQLSAHFQRHGREGPWSSEQDYDRSARETILTGNQFGYVDRQSNAERLGFYDRPTNRFTSLTRDGQRITTHFKPDRGEAYVRGLDSSTYR